MGAVLDGNDPLLSYLRIMVADGTEEHGGGSVLVAAGCCQLANYVDRFGAQLHH
ncbi:hypothetical protein VRY54_10195 [Actinomyces sp. F1_1611]